MTGQVKERIITRLHELGVVVRSGRLSFRPELLAASEFLASSDALTLEGHETRAKEIPVAAGSLAFTFCGVPVVYSIATDVPTITVTLADGSTTEFRTGELDTETSRAVFSRSGKVKRIDVTLDRHALRVS